MNDKNPEIERKYIFPAILSLLIPGFGQVIKGHVLKGIIIFFGMIICFFVIIGIVLSPIIWIWNIYDAYTSNSKEILKPKKENKEKEREVREKFEEQNKPEEFEEVVKIDILKANDKKQQGMAIINKFEITDITDEHYETAEYEFREALNFNPDDVEARLYLALCLGHKGKVVEIIRLVEEIVRLEPDNTAHAILGRIYDYQKRYEDAAKEYKKVKKIFSNDPDIIKSQEVSTDKFAQIMLGLPPGDENLDDICKRSDKLQRLLKKPGDYCIICEKKLGFVNRQKIDAKISICTDCGLEIDTLIFGKECPICRSCLSITYVDPGDNTNIRIKCKICGATFKKIASTSMFAQDIWKLTDGDSPHLNKGFTGVDWTDIKTGKLSGSVVCPGCNSGIITSPKEGENLECKYCGRKLEVKGKQVVEIQEDKITSIAMYKVIVHSTNISWPPVCSICLGPAQEFKTRTDRSSLDLIVYYSSKTYTLPNVPYCHSCYQKMKKILFGKENEGIRISKSSKPDNGIIELYFRNPEYAKMFRELNE